MRISDFEVEGRVLPSFRHMRILVADDHPAVLDAARLLLKTHGYSAATADTPQSVLKQTAAQKFDLILMDLNYARDTTSGQEGLDLLASLRSSGVESPIVVMTAWGTVDVAVEAMRRGACDFVQKPWDNARLLDTIERHVDRARAERSDIDIARSVQRNLLPRERPQAPGLDYAASCVPARAVGGDYYDWFSVGGAQTAFLVADVSGKGVGSALLMANLHGAMRTRLAIGFTDSPSLISGLNRQFYEASLPEQFATLLFVRYDARSRRLSWVNAGHPPGLLVRSGGSVEQLSATALPVGAFPVWASEEPAVELSPGDRVVLYSDGVTEAGLGTHDEFGIERLTDAAVAGGTAEEVVERICRCVTAWDGNAYDDCTVVVLRCL